MPFSTTPLFGMTIRESANDGSDFTNPSADYRRLFLGEDGQLHVKDSAGTVTDIGGGTPPGTELDYAEFTSAVNVTATVEASGDTVISGNSVAYDGTPIWVEFFSHDVAAKPTAGAYLILSLWDGATELGNIAIIQDPTGATSISPHFPVLARRKLTPSAASHTYIIKGHTSGGQPGIVEAGAGGVATRLPGYIRVTKA